MIEAKDEKAVLDVIFRHGASGASMDAIAESTGLSRWIVNDVLCNTATKFWTFKARDHQAKRNVSKYTFVKPEPL